MERNGRRENTPAFQLPDDQLETLLQFLQHWAQINTLIELRGMESPYRKQILVAYLEPDPEYLNAPTLAKLLRETDGVNLYVTVNAVHPGAIGRSPFLWTPSGKATGQSDITRITHLVLDFDPVRPSGVASNTSEHEQALHAADWLVRAVQRHYNRNPRLVLDTGNGAQVLYALDAPNTPETVRQLKGAIEYFQRGVEKQFPTVKLDPATTNPAQLTRLPFTKNAKGYEWKDRVHRTVRILAFEPNTEPVPLELWQPPQTRTKPTQTTPNPHTPTELEPFLEQLRACGLEPLQPRPLQNDAWLIPLRRCAFNPSHEHGHQNPAVIYNHGKIGYKCFHSDCAHNDGRAFRKWLHAQQPIPEPQ